MSISLSDISLRDVSLAGLVGGAAFSVLGAYNTSKSNKKAYQYNAAVEANNAKFADMQAHDAIARGETAEATSRMKTAQLAGHQRAIMAARGIALDEGSPLNILNDTAYMGEQDARVIRDNAAKEAWALRNQSTNYKSNAALLDARADAENPFLNATGTLLTAGGTVADRWYKYSKSTTAVS